MSSHAFVVLPLLLTLCAALSSADVSALRQNRFGRIIVTRLQRQRVAPYPAAGYRPQQPFETPSPQDKQQFFPARNNNNPQQFAPQPQSSDSGFDLAATPSLGPNGDTLQQPNALYDAPARFRQFAPARQQQQFGADGYDDDNDAPQRYYGAPVQEPQAERISVAQLQPQQEEQKSARLSDNREEREDDQETVTDIEVDAASATEKKPTTAAPTAPPATGATPNVVYYPAGAVGFVHPAFAAYYQPAALLAATAAATTVPAATATPATATTAATPASDASESESKSESASAESKSARATSAAALAPAAAFAAFAAPQYYASPYLQQFAYAAPAQLQAW